MKVEWDTAKAKANRRKHGIDFADAATVLLDEFASTVRDHSSDEERYATIGADALGRVLVIVYACPEGERLRVISARRATKKERRQYEEET